MIKPSGRVVVYRLPDRYFALNTKASLPVKLGKRTVRDYLQRPQYELYNLQHDPDEVLNLAYDPSFRKLADYCRQRLYDFQHETGDIWSIYQDYEKVREMRDKLAANRDVVMEIGGGSIVSDVSGKK